MYITNSASVSHKRVAAIPGWTQGHQAGQRAFGSSHCPSTCSNTVANHGVSAWSRHPQTPPWATRQETSQKWVSHISVDHIRNVISIKQEHLLHMNVVKIITWKKMKHLRKRLGQRSQKASIWSSPWFMFVWALRVTSLQLHTMFPLCFDKWTAHGSSLNLFFSTAAQSGGPTVLTKPNLPRRITLPLRYGHLWHWQPQVGKATRDFAANTELPKLSHLLIKFILRKTISAFHIC